MAGPLYCNSNDVRVICAIQKSEVSDEQISSIIGKAMADIDSGIGSMYNVPFNDVVKHPKGIPEKIRWMTAELAKCIIQSREYDESEPNQIGTTQSCYARVNAQISALIKCDASLTYPDNTPVPRIGDCPDDSPSGEQGYIPVMSNTINDDAIFTLDDITDSETDHCAGYRRS